MIPAIEAGFFQREIAEAAFRYQQEIDRGERTIVGVNDYVSGRAAGNPDPLRWTHRATNGRWPGCGSVRAERDNGAVTRLPGPAARGRTR